MKKHINIPIFIPHEGCPNDCVFCNQRKITGTTLSADRDIRPEIESALSTTGDDVSAQIAFFGGSFTGIEKSVMVRLLSDAYEYIKAKKVESIRLSTRPDYIDDEILDILSRYGVKNIELGIQSASDTVLKESKRGHTFSQTAAACEKIVKKGFILGGQMMIGLPGSSVEDEINTAKQIVKLGAREARIYPTVVFYDTELCEMARSGKYVPLSDDVAAERAAACYRVFLENGVSVLRVGLQATDNLYDEKAVFGGANHPAMGEMCEGLLYFSLIKEKIRETLNKNKNIFDGRKTLIIHAPYGEVSKVSGHKKGNKKKLEEYFSQHNIAIEKIKIKETKKEKFCIDISAE